MSITTIAPSPAAFVDNVGLLTMPPDCQGYYLLGTDQASSVVDQMGGAPLTITGTVNYQQGYADFRGGAYARMPATSPSRDRTTLLVSTSSADEKVLEGGAIVWPPALGPAEMRYGGGYLLEWNGGNQFFAISDGSVIRTEGGDLTTSTAQKSNDPIAYTDGTFTPQFWGGGLITGASATTALAPAGQGAVILMQPFSGTPAAADRTMIGNRTGPANSHACIAAIAQFPTLSVDQARVRLDKMLTDVSRRLGYRIKNGDLNASV